MKHVLKLLIFLLFWLACKHFNDKASATGNHSEIDQFFLSNSQSLFILPSVFLLYCLYHFYLAQRKINRFLTILSKTSVELLSLYNFTFGIYFIYLTVYMAEEARVKKGGSSFEFHDLDFGSTIGLYLLLFFISILAQTVLMLLLKLFKGLDYFRLSWQYIPISFNSAINLFLMFSWF